MKTALFIPLFFILTISYGQDVLVKNQVLIKDSLYLVKYQGKSRWTPARFKSYEDGRFSISLFEKQRDIETMSLKKVSPIETSQIRKGKYYFPDINAAKYVFSNPAFALPKGEFRFHTTFTFLSLEYGINKYISLEAGGEAVSIALGRPTLYAKARLSIPIISKLSLGMSYTYVNHYSNFQNDFYGNSKYKNQNYGFGSIYLTFGNRENNLTAGISSGSILPNNYYDRYSLNTPPTYSLSAKIRLTRKLFFMTEHLYFPYYDEDKAMRYRNTGFVGLSIAFKNSSLGVGVQYMTSYIDGSSRLGFIPMITYSIRF